MKKRLTPFLLIAFLLILGSCIGISADIQMRKDGSGRITLEYRFSRMAETLGRLDGNEKWPVIPVGRADLERTLARIPDMKLVSFSTREESSLSGADKDVVNQVTLEFKNPEALLAFLDPSGRRAALTQNNSSNRMDITINEPASSETDPDLLDLMKQVSAGYKLNISFSVDGGNSALTLIDGAGSAINNPPNAEVVPSGKKVSLSIGTGEILSLKQGLGISLSW
jgi:hypothetical protein